MNEDDPGPSTIEQAFYAAFARRDAEAMRRVWADDARAVCVHPGGPLLRGTEAILESWQDILSGVAPPEIQHRQIQQVRSGELAVHTVEELIRPADSDQTPTKVIATNIYARTASGWRMLAHHASLPLVRQGRAARGPLH
jgi:uncharacterized protein (TIGR02246 family)